MSTKHVPLRPGIPSKWISDTPVRIDDSLKHIASGKARIHPYDLPHIRSVVENTAQLSCYTLGPKRQRMYLACCGDNYIYLLSETGAIFVSPNLVGPDGLSFYTMSFSGICFVKGSKFKILERGDSTHATSNLGRNWPSTNITSRYMGCLHNELSDVCCISTISYVCLSRFLCPKLEHMSSEKVWSAFWAKVFPLIQSNVVLDDAFPAETTHVLLDDPEQIALFQHPDGGISRQSTNEIFAQNPKLFKALSIGPGFVPIKHHYTSRRTQVRVTFHKSSTVLIFDSAKKAQYVFGVDEDSYFGSQLPRFKRRIRSGTEALMCLAPDDALVDASNPIYGYRKFVERQGEWFFVPRFDVDIPTPSSHPSECLELENAVLPKDSVDSSSHILGSCDGGTEAWVHLPTGRIFIKRCSLVHSNGDHADLCLPSWGSYFGQKPNGIVSPRKSDDKFIWEILRNTAVKSFSEEGVD